MRNLGKLVKKDKHHISWKNHRIDQYITEAYTEYLKRKGGKTL